MIKVSVVIPVYNAAAYLDKCMASLLSQSVACEFIFVNDGSTDDSKSIIENALDKDSRIKLLHQENQGVSAARNAGMAAAKGEYLAFVDADDYVESDMFAQLYSAAASHQADIVISNFYLEQDRTKLLIDFDFPKDVLLNKGEIAEKIYPYFVSKELMNSACNKIFKREMIVAHQIEFPAGVTLGEDAIFNMKAFSKCDRAFYIDYAGYHYREIHGSATRNVRNNDYFKRVLEAWHFDYRALLPLQIDDSALNKLKAEKLVASVLSLVHLYFNAAGIGLGSKSRIVKQMINSREVVETLNNHYEEFSASRDRYSKFLLRCIKNKDTYFLYLAVLYSRFRNR